MDHRWIWVLILCLAATLAIWERHEQVKQIRSTEPTALEAAAGSLSIVPQPTPLSSLRLIGKGLRPKSQEQALASALRQAYPQYDSLEGRSVHTQWLNAPVDPTETSSNQLVLAATILPHDGFIAAFSQQSDGQFRLKSLLTNMAHIDEAQSLQIVSDAPEELAVTQTLNQLVGAFFKITMYTVFKWSEKQQQLVKVWEYPLEVEEYDISTGFEAKNTRRTEINTTIDSISVYEVATTWHKDAGDESYQPVDTTTKRVRFVWDSAQFAFVPETPTPQ